MAEINTYLAAVHCLRWTLHRSPARSRISGWPRAEGLGMGWVSLFDVDEVRRLLQMPEGAKPVAMLCLGHVEAFYERPMLEAQGWASRVPLERCVFENVW